MSCANASTSGTDATTTTATPKQQLFVITYSIAKNQNLGTLLRSCVGFGVTEVFIVGKQHYNTFGSHGAAKYVQTRHFDKLEECVEFAHQRGAFARLVVLNEPPGITVCGVEIVPQAESVASEPFRSSRCGTAIMMGTEGTGMNEKQKKLCDHFVYIPQFGNGTASLNVTVAASIVLHRFASWAQFEEAPRNEADPTKFLVDTSARAPEKLRTTDEAKRKHMQRAEARRKLGNDEMEEGPSIDWDEDEL